MGWERGRTTAPTEGFSHITATHLRSSQLGPGVGPLLGPSPNLQSDCGACGEKCCKMRAGGTICRV